MVKTKAKYEKKPKDSPIPLEQVENTIAELLCKLMDAPAILVKTFTDMNYVRKLTLNYSCSVTVLLNPKPKNIGPLAGKVRSIERQSNSRIKLKYYKEKN